MSELLPLFPLSTVLFPGMRLPLHIFEERYRLLVTDLQALPEPRRFGVIAIRKVREVTSRAGGRFDLAAVGSERFRLLRVDDSLPYFRGEVELLGDEPAAGQG